VNTQLCQVFLGNRIDDRNELRFLQRVCSDLERRRCAARICANFITRRSQRQVDFLISTVHRLVHVELKTVDPELPLVGSANGSWEQQLPDGQRRSLERNYYRQAQSTTFAISDDMHDLARSGDVPRSEGKFYADIHTVICVFPDVPAGSRLDSYRYVDVVGYRQLLQLLCNDGPHPAWDDEHWSAFIRHLQLFPESIDGDDQAEQRISRTLVEDYRRRFVAARRPALQAYVPIAARQGETLVPDPAEFLMEATASGQMVVVVGQSGAGKSHAAQHAAVAIAQAGGVPVWVRCGEYQRGRFSHALSRAVAPFTTQACLPLLHSATDLGCPVVVFLDGVNECTPADREVLIEQLDALRLRLPAGVVITSTGKVKPPSAEAVILDALLPDDDARTALMAAHGRHGELSGLAAFRTPMELAMAAECGESLRPGATSTELFEVYVTRLCSSESTRSGLRRIASEIDTQMRGSLTVAEARLLLHRVAGVQAIDMDAVLSSPLLSATQGRIAFGHELLARFLTAEQLVLDAADGRALAEALRDVRRADLRDHAVKLETDAGRRRDLLFALADVGLLRAAAHGAFGAETAQAVVAEVSAVLDQATAAIDDFRFVDVEGMPDGASELYWTTDNARSDLQQALLCVAGRCLADGVFVDEAAALLDATDQRCAEEMRRLRVGGNRRSISSVVRATYGRFTYSDDRQRCQLPASVVVTACEHGWIKEMRPSPAPSPMRRLWERPGRPRWGRLTAALLMMNPNDPADRALLPDVFAAAWKANGYHLRLMALDTALRGSYDAEEITRQRMRSLLDDCNKDNIMLNGLLFETLAAYGGLEPLKTEDDILAEIAEILAAPADPQAWEAAQHMIGMFFEDQRLHGPYIEVLCGLGDADALRLHVMAARSSTFPFYRDTIMKVIVDRVDQVDDDGRDALRDAILRIDWDNPFRDETIRAHLIAVYGWGSLADRLPPARTGDDDLITRAWRIVDELLFAASGGTDTDTDALEALWSELLGPCADAAADVVAHVRSACRFSLTRLEPSPYECLVNTWPEQMRQLFERCLPYRGQAGASFDRRTAHDARRDLVADLAYVGTEATTVLLEPYLTDPRIGATVVDVIRAIKRRMDGVSQAGTAHSADFSGSGAII
jgi:hypothetical protein